MDTTTEGWEKKAIEFFVDEMPCACGCSVPYIRDEYPKEVIDFIRSLLNTAKQEGFEEAKEKMLGLMSKKRHPQGALEGRE